MRPNAIRLVLTALLTLTLAACGHGGGGAVTSDDMSLGNANAKVTVIEYASAGCPHCARFNDDVFPAFKAKYITTGKVHYIFREFLAGQTTLAAAGFLTARCAGKDKYFAVLDAIFHSQAVLTESGDFRSDLLNIAKSAGMSEQQFDDCISNDAALQALNDRVQTYATRDGINSTPTFIINGTRLENEQSLASLDKAIADAQAAAK